MDYASSFTGRFNLDKPLSEAHLAYLQKFNDTRRMKRNEWTAEMLSDPLRTAVGLPVGLDGGYFVGGGGYRGQDHDASVLGYNEPPEGQPGLWCRWMPSADGEHIEWDKGEKFYGCVPWLEYIVEHFLRPWGYVLSGRVGWREEEDSDFGVIVVKDNKVEASNFVRFAEGQKDAVNSDEDFDKFLQDSCTQLDDLWSQFGGTTLNSDDLIALNHTLTMFFEDKRN